MCPSLIAGDLVPRESPVFEARVQSCSFADLLSTFRRKLESGRQEDGNLILQLASIIVSHPLAKFDRPALEFSEKEVLYICRAAMLAEQVRWMHHLLFFSLFTMFINCIDAF